MYRAILIVVAIGCACLSLRAAAELTWVPGDNGFVHTHRAIGGQTVRAASVHYPRAEPVAIEREAITTGDDGVVSIAVPPSPTDSPGVAKLMLSMENGDTVEKEIPVSLYREIDITGPAAESLYTPLPTNDYLVDYIPCCNIYGGLLIAERIPVNPWDTDAGLPDELLTDFVQLMPDGLTASTMGLYFEFGYDSDLPAENIGLYEFGREEWREVFDYTVDADNKRVRFHCPDGGTFVLATKTDESPTEP